MVDLERGKREDRVMSDDRMKSDPFVVAVSAKQRPYMSLISHLRAPSI